MHDVCMYMVLTSLNLCQLSCHNTLAALTQYRRCIFQNNEQVMRRDIENKGMLQICSMHTELHSRHINVSATLHTEAHWYVTCIAN